MTEKTELKTQLETQGVKFRCFYRTDKSIVRIYMPQTLRNNEKAHRMISDLFDNLYELDFIDSYPDYTDKYRLIPKGRYPWNRHKNSKSMEDKRNA